MVLEVLELDNLTWASRPEDLSEPAQELPQLQVGFQRLSHFFVPATYLIKLMVLQVLQLSVDNAQPVKVRCHVLCVVNRNLLDQVINSAATTFVFNGSFYKVKELAAKLSYLCGMMAISQAMCLEV